jgi:hypothetical protein
MSISQRATRRPHWPVAVTPPRTPGPPDVTPHRSEIKYSRDGIKSLMRQWDREYGGPPEIIDWEPASARRLGQDWQAERFEEGQWPSTQQVCHLFSTFGDAVAESGLSANPRKFGVPATPASRDAVVAAIVEWTQRYGDVPTMADWDPPRARRLNQDWRVARYRQGIWPSTKEVAQHFGSLSAAVAAAGMRPHTLESAPADRSEDQLLNRLVVAHHAAVGRPAGVKDLAACLIALAAARRCSDPLAVQSALIDVVRSALAWAGEMSLTEDG